MAVNISSRLSTLHINGVDYTSQFGVLTGSDNHVEGSGLCSFQGTITLAPTIGAELDDWLVANFETGHPVILNTQDESRTMRRHPRGALRIINPAFNDSTGEQLLRVGDLIALLSYRHPINEDLINVAPTGTTIRSVIDQTLALAGVSSVLWRTNRADQYLFRCPIVLKNGYLDTVDKLLYSLGLLGWINNQEQFVIDEINLAPSVNAFEIVLGHSDAGDISRLNAKPIPAEIIKAFGSYRQVTERPALIDRLISLQVGPIDDLIPGQQGGTGTLRREREIERYFPNNIIQVEIERILDLLSYWVYQGYPGFSRTGNSRAQTDLVYYTFEQGGSGKLLQIYSETRKPQVLAIPDYVKWAYDNNDTLFGNLILGQTTFAGKSLKVFTYNEAEQLIKTDETIWETESDIIGQLGFDWQLVYDAVGIPNDLRQSERTIIEWREEHDGWLRFTTHMIAKARDPKYREALPERLEEDGVSPIDVIRESTALTIQSTGQRDASNAGVVTPPATEHIPRQYIDKPFQLEAKIHFPQFSSTFRERERSIQIPYLPDIVDDPSPAQAVLNHFAQIQGAILKGQYRGIRVPTELLDVYFDDYRPLMPFVLQKLNNSRFQLAMDGTSWTMNREQIIVSTDAIYLAQLIDGSPVPPFRPSYDWISGLNLGGVFEFNRTQIVIPMGLVLGAVFIQDATLTFCWDSLTAAQFDRLSSPQLDILATGCRTAIEACWDSITPELFDRLTAAHLDLLASQPCIYLLTICWDTLTPEEFDLASPAELDQLAQFDCSFI